MTFSSDTLLSTKHYRAAHELVHPADLFHFVPVVREDLGELGLAYGADEREEIGPVGVLYSLVRLHPGHGALDADVHQLVRQETSAPAAAEGALADGVRRHVHELV